jgi:hypothetical protein
MGAVFVVNGVTIGFVGLPEYYPMEKVDIHSFKGVGYFEMMTCISKKHSDILHSPSL